MRTWFITGASRGFGALIAEAALAKGDAVVATARNPQGVIDRLGAHDNLLTVALDVTDEAQGHAAAKAAVERFGRIDVLVNNAGYGLLGAVEEATGAEIEALYRTNVFGLLAVTRAVLPHMRRQRSGRILNLSSVGGIRSGPGFGVYCSTKFAVEGLTEALATELSPLGVFATAVEPGYFRTDFLDATSVVYAANPIADYAQASAALREFYEARSHNQAGDPAKLGQALVALANAENPPVRWAAGTDAVGMIQGKIAGLTTELEAWRGLSQSTDGDFSFREESGASAWG